MSAFREYMSTTGHVDFQHPPARHHLYLITQLERLDRGEIQRLLVLAPPGSAKSTYCSIQYPLQRLAKRPDENILCASNTQSLAEEFNRRRRNAALTPEWSRLSGTALAADKQGVEHFTTLKQGGIRASGVGSSIVGFRSRLNILDDPITGFEQAMSAGTLEKQWSWFNQDFRTRLAGSDSQELIISTRWAKRDIPGRILELIKEGKEDWEVVRLPMEADRDDDPLGRDRGEPLWPEWYSDKKLVELKRDAFLWNTQFQQTPLDETGNWVTKGQIEYCFEDAAPSTLKKVIGFDLALSVGKGDYTVIVVAGLCSDGLLHILDVSRRRVDPQTTALDLLTLADAHEAVEVLADDDNSTKVFRSGLHETARRTNRTFALNLMPMRGKDKETRAAPLRMLFMSGRIRIVRAPWNADLVRELLEWDTDDQIDSLGLIARRLPYLSAPEPPPSERDPYEFTITRPYELPNGKVGLCLNAGLDEMFEDRERARSRTRGRI
jgi:predicted phage terminase large subunit-like protein